MVTLKEARGGRSRFRWEFSITHWLLKISNRCMEMIVLPEGWKMKCIIPVYKARRGDLVEVHVSIPEELVYLV